VVVVVVVVMVAVVASAVVVTRVGESVEGAVNGGLSYSNEFESSFAGSTMAGASVTGVERSIGGRRGEGSREDGLEEAGDSNLWCSVTALTMPTGSSCA
jgi:hypothetical protein